MEQRSPECGEAEGYMLQVRFISCDCQKSSYFSSLIHCHITEYAKPDCWFFRKVLSTSMAPYSSKKARGGIWYRLSVRVPRSPNTAKLFPQTAVLQISTRSKLEPTILQNSEPFAPIRTRVETLPMFNL